MVAVPPAAWGGEKPEGGAELLANAAFASSAGQPVPHEWTLQPLAVKDACCRVRAVEGGLAVDAPGRPFGVGIVWQDVHGIEGQKSYAVDVAAKAEKVPAPYRSILVRLSWTRGGKPLHPAGLMVRGPIAAEAGLRFADVLVAPKEADGARLSLEVKWPQGGSVLWQRAGLRAAAPPPPRKVKIGTVYLRPRNSTPQRNLQLFCDKVDEAGRLKLDIVCLPEGIMVVGTTKNGPQTAEPIPGPTSERLAQAARKNHLWLVAGLYERDGDAVYNAAVLLDREGRLAGKYRKIHLPREEWQLGITPGNCYPVFKTDFGTVAMQVCYDYFFPEEGEILALKGAEIAFAPTWGTTFKDQEGRVEGENTFRVRARDNGIYLVPSVYDGNSMVIDPLGRVLATSDGHEGLFWCETDLSRRDPLPWVGHWRSLGPRDRMPASYGNLLGDPAEPAHP
jgi:predicted amidohydrolase